MKFMISTLKLLTAVAVMGASGSTWSAVATENLLGDSYYATTHKPRIDMTGINLKYNKSGLFSGKSSRTSTFTLVKPNADTLTFSGKFSLKANISDSGVLGNNGVFEFTSKDTQFGFGKNCDRSICNGKTGTVFAGTLTSVGWSDTNGFLEFGIGNFSGWACTMGWCTEAERLWFNTSGQLGLPDAINRDKNWRATANGTAVIPVPAAAWLLGSGLIGLAGFARRKVIQ